MSPRNAILVLALAAPARVAAQPVAGPYVNLGAGLSVLQNAILTPAGADRASLAFAPGASVAAGAGMGFGGGLRLELEGDFSTARPRGSATGGTTDSYGGFVNALYDFTTGTGFVPFLGIGAGYQSLDVDRETGSAFGYQGIAGLSYPVGLVPGLSLTAEYRLVGSALFAGGPPVSNVFDHQALLGLRYAFGSPPPASPAEIPAATPAPPAAGPRARTYLVFFDWDRADLSARARQIIAEAAEASRQVRSTRIEVSGYTDASGTRTYNQSLSVRRAETVAAELVRDGVAAADIAIHGLGESNPLVPTAAGVRQAQNRRVEIVVK